MQDNSLYHGHKKGKEEEEFPPDAYESQYEPPPSDGHAVPLRPKPTHPTEPPSTEPLPLYDTLNPAGRQVSTYSSTSSRDLPNPLYSGTRPTSQHDSGSGHVRERGGGGRGKSEEPLYSEANNPLESSGVVYSEPDSRGSKLLADSSPAPPVPPDPRTIPTASPPHNTAPVINSLNDIMEFPTYAEAGPAGSQEHLYSELPDRRDPESSPSRRPNFNIPPPPPTLPPPSSSWTYSPPLEPTYSIPKATGSPQTESSMQ